MRYQQKGCLTTGCEKCGLCLAPKEKKLIRPTHTVSTDALATLGNIIDETAGRDAIHLAVEPAVAVEKLYPGQHVGFVEGGVGIKGEHIGIVDPFLDGFVAPGQMFWLVIYPRTITSLRHVWEHPSIPSSLPSPQSIEEETIRLSTLAINTPMSSLTPKITNIDKEKSEKWLRDFTSDWGCYGYGDEDDEEDGFKVLMRSLNSYGGDDYLTIIGYDAYGGIPSEFWDHVEIYTGEKFNRATYFSCSC